MVQWGVGSDTWLLQPVWWGVPCSCSGRCTHFLACRLSRFGHVRLFVNWRTKVRQAPLSIGFSRREYWSELPCPPPGDLPDPGIVPTSLTFPFTSLTCSYKNIFHVFMLKRKVHSLGTENKKNGCWHTDQRNWATDRNKKSSYVTDIRRLISYS